MKKLNKSERLAIVAEVRQALQEGIDKIAKKKHAMSEAEVDMKTALMPVAGMTPQEIADLVEPILAKGIMSEAEKVDTNTIKKLVYKALAGLGITTSITSIVYTSLLSSPKTSPIIEKIINGTLSPDASLIAGVIGIVLGGLIASVGVDATRAMKDKVDKTQNINELSPELRKRAFDTAVAKYSAIPGDDEDVIAKSLARRQADRFATQISPDVDAKVKALSSQIGLSVELTKGVDSDYKPFVKMFFLGNRQGKVGPYNYLFTVYVTKEGYKVEDKENIPAESLKGLMTIIKTIQAKELA